MLGSLSPCFEHQYNCLLVVIVCSTYVEHDCRRDVDTNQTTSLDEQLEVIGGLVARVQTPVLARLVRDLEHAVNLALVEADTSSELGKALVRLVPGLVDDTDVKVVGLLVEEGSGKGPEFGSVGPEDCDGGFVDQGRGRVPGLDLLAEDDLEFARVFLLDQRGHVVVEGVELLFAEGADVVEDCGGFVRVLVFGLCGLDQEAYTVQGCGRLWG